MISAILFDMYSTLYDSNLLKNISYSNALKAMINTGLTVDFNYGYQVLMESVKSFPQNVLRQFREMLNKLEMRFSPKILAVGINTFLETEKIYLKTFSDTIPTLIKLRELKYKLGLISTDKSLTVWTKLIRLKIHPFFHSIVTAPNFEVEYKELLMKCLKKLLVDPNETIFIGQKKLVSFAKEMNMITITLSLDTGELNSNEEQYSLKKISDIFPILNTLDRNSY